MSNPEIPVNQDQSDGKETLGLFSYVGMASELICQQADKVEGSSTEEVAKDITEMIISAGGPEE